MKAFAKELFSPFNHWIYIFGAGYGTAVDNGFIIVPCVVMGVITFGFWMKRNGNL